MRPENVGVVSDARPAEEVIVLPVRLEIVHIRPCRSGRAHTEVESLRLTVCRHEESQATSADTAGVRLDYTERQRCCHRGVDRVPASAQDANSCLRCQWMLG